MTAFTRGGNLTHARKVIEPLEEFRAVKRGNFLSWKIRSDENSKELCGTKNRLSYCLSYQSCPAACCIVLLCAVNVLANERNWMLAFYFLHHSIVPNK